MGRAEALDVRSVSRLLLRAIPGVAASAVAAFVIYAIHVSRPPQTLEQLSEVTPQSDELSAEERRGLTRQMLKERRENPGAAGRGAADAPPVDRGNRDRGRGQAAA